MNRFPITQKQFRAFMASDKAPKRRGRWTATRCIMELAIDALAPKLKGIHVGYYSAGWSYGPRAEERYKMPAWALRIVNQYDDGVPLSKLKY